MKYCKYFYETPKSLLKYINNQEFCLSFIIVLFIVRTVLSNLSVVKLQSSNILPTISFYSNSYSYPFLPCFSELPLLHTL